MSQVGDKTKAGDSIEVSLGVSPAELIKQFEPPKTIEDFLNILQKCTFIFHYKNGPTVAQSTFLARDFQTANQLCIDYVKKWGFRMVGVTEYYYDFSRQPRNPRRLGQAPPDVDDPNKVD